MVFQSFRDDNWEIYLMNADGSGQTNISNNSAQDIEPDWSPVKPASMASTFSACCRQAALFTIASN